VTLEGDALETLLARAGEALGQRVVAWRPVRGGYSQAARLVVELAGGGSAFVKGAVDALTADWLRAEHAVYASVREDFMPRMLAWRDDAEAPLLALEDLGAAHWPPPWDVARIEAVREALRRVAATTPPAGHATLEEWRPFLSGWQHVAEDPAPFLALGLVTPRWLQRALPSLLVAETAAPLAGEALLHNDVRSDNLCFTERGVVLVDWNWSRVGNAEFDVAAWLPSLELEGGPPPEAILPNAPELAGIVSGFYAEHAGLPAGELPPAVRGLQRAQLGTALPWAIRALRLPPMDGAARAGGTSSNT
jgi:hypothetical protein